MTRYLLFSIYSLLFTLYLGVFGAFANSFNNQLLAIAGILITAIAGGMYLNEKINKANLFALIGLGFLSAKAYAHWMMLSLIIESGDNRFLLFLLPGIGITFLYTITIISYLNPKWKKIELINREINDNNKKLLFGLPIIANLGLMIYLMF